MTITPVQYSTVQYSCAKLSLLYKSEKLSTETILDKVRSFHNHYLHQNQVSEQSQNCDYLRAGFLSRRSNISLEICLCIKSSIRSDEF